MAFQNQELQFARERLAIDIFQAVSGGTGTAKSAYDSNTAARLSVRQTACSDSAFDLAAELDTKMTRETHSQDLKAYFHAPDAETPQIQIRVVLKHKAVSVKRRHLRVRDWDDLYGKMPWLMAQHVSMALPKADGSLINMESSSGSVSRRAAQCRILDRLRSRVVQRNEARLQASADALAKDTALELRQKEILAAATKRVGALGIRGIFDDEDMPERRKPPRLSKFRQRFLLALGRSRHQRERENRAMQQSVEFHQHAAVGDIRAITGIKMTLGTKECLAEAEKQQELRMQGLPHYCCCEKSLGTYEQLFVWFEVSTRSSAFVTSIDLEDVTQPLGDDGSGIVDRDEPPEEIISTTTSRLARRLGGEYQRTDPDLSLRIKRDPFSETVLCDIDVAYDEAQSHRDGGWKQIGPNLEVYGFSSVSIWVKMISRACGVDGANKAALVQSDAALQPDSALQEDHVSASTRNSTHVNVGGDPLKYTIEFLGLSKDEVRVLLSKFEEMDVDRRGVIPAKAFMATHDEHCGFVASALFTLLGSLNDCGELTFGEFAKAVGTFSCFDTNSVLQLLFDVHMVNGLVRVPDISNLANRLHHGGPSINRLRQTVRALDSDGSLSFPEFCELHKKAPILLFPAFRFQECVRQHTFGQHWWTKRLRTFQLLRSRVRLLPANGAH